MKKIIFLFLLVPTLVMAQYTAESYQYRKASLYEELGVQKNNIVLTAYAPLGSQKGHEGAENWNVLTNPVIEKLAAKLNCSAAQVVLAWLMQRGFSVIPKSVHMERLKENFAAQSVTLDEDDMKEIEALDRHHRFVDGSSFAVDGSDYSIANIWDEEA